MPHGLIGRVEELLLLDDLLAEKPTAPAVFVHGPGGIGKSALLREVVRRAENRGLASLIIDGRYPAVAQQDARQVVGGPRDGGQLLVVVDGYEHVTALGAPLRADLSDLVGPGTRLLIAGRQPPEPAWRQGVWQNLLRTIELGPVSRDEAHELLEHRGVRDPAAADQIVGWAAGSPLALGVAADAVVAGQSPDLAQLDRDASIARTLLGQLAGDEMDGADREVLAVGAIARAVDARLLAAVLPGVDADHAEAWLRSRSFAEPYGVRVTLHEQVRGAMRGHLMATDAEYERELRRRIADHLYGRGVLGELWLLPELAELIDDPTARWGASAPQGAIYSCGFPVPGDAEEIAAAIGATGTEWWEGVRRWFDDAPENALVVRDADGDIVVGGVVFTPASAPDWVSEDRIGYPLLAEARTRFPDGDVLVMREAIVLPASEASPEPSRAVAAGNTMALLGSGLPTVRGICVAVRNESPEQRDFFHALGHVRLENLDIVDGGHTINCYVRDFGPGGVIGFTRKLVYQDLGRRPPPDRPHAAAGADAVRDALRAFHDPSTLAASPLARGGTTDDRAASVRRLLEHSVATAFGESEDEQLMRSLVERAYFVPEGGHARAEQDLHMSRTTYFRRLRAAVARVCDQVLDARSP